MVGWQGPEMSARFTVTLLDHGLWRNPSIARLLGSLSIDIGYSGQNAVRVGWGRKPSGRRASFISRLTGVPCCLLEDGFLRSVTPGRGTPSFSVVIDSLGIYYDAQSPSRLEELIRDSVPDIDRTRRLIALWQEQRVSKYNHLPEYKGALPDRYVLVADQTYGDMHDILAQLIEVPASLHVQLPSLVAARADFARCLEIAELAQSFGARSRRAQATPLQVGNAHLDVKADLVIHVRAYLGIAPDYVTPGSAPPVDRHIKPAAEL